MATALIRPARRRPLATALAAAALLAVQGEAGAVITTTYLTLSSSSLTLRVGSAGGTIDNVDFDVSGANIRPSPAPVTRPDTVTVTLTANKAILSLLTSARLTADSSAGLSCQTPSSCGSTIIPFSSISWVSTNPEPLGGDIQSGSFTGAGAQQLASFALPVLGLVLSARTVMTNNLRFTYANSTLYPSGVYRGRVVFTASMI